MPVSLKSEYIVTYFLVYCDNWKEKRTWHSSKNWSSDINQATTYSDATKPKIFEINFTTTRNEKQGLSSLLD